MVRGFQAPSLPQQTMTTLSAEYPPARLQLQTQPTLQSTQTFHTAGQQPSSTPKSNASQVLDQCLSVI